MTKNRSLLLLPLLLLWNTTLTGPARAVEGPLQEPDVVTDGSAVFSIPSVPKPTYLAPTRDTTFHSTILRVGNNVGASTAPVSGSWGSDARHVYSKQQPWNSDNTLLTIENRSGGSPTPMIIDGTTYAPKLAPCGN